MALQYNVTNWYWSVTGYSTIWSSARLMYVSTADSKYQLWLQSGGSLITLPNFTALANGMISQLVPILLQSGLEIISNSNPGINSTYGLDKITLGMVGTIARDSASGLGLPQGLTTVLFSDINGNVLSFTPSQIQNLYKALRDYISAYNSTITSLVNMSQATFPVQPVYIA